MRIVVFGAGAWGTTVAIHLARKGGRVVLWARDRGRAAEMQEVRENRRHLAGHPLPRELIVTHDLMGEFDLIVNAVPTQHVRETFGSWKGRLGDAPVVSLSKGLELGTGLRPTEVIGQVLGARRPTGVLTGPCIAAEVVRGLPTAVLLAGREVSRFQPVFNSNLFRVYTSDDLVGAELIGGLKNVMGIAAGIVDGLGLGDNAKASLLTRGVVEIARLGTALGARPATFYGLAGFGDLFTTCVSPHGRNRGFGERLGRGETVDEIVQSTPSVTEGVPTTKAVLAVAEKKGIELPITEVLCRILFEGLDPKAGVNALMTRALRPEV
ncbi:MAG: NAD(P)H-dependent glycerol-3-phosphate dehydrogenase [Planctomycetota bacterium]